MYFDTVVFVIRISECGARGGGHRNGFIDCLTKTQVRANS